MTISFSVCPELRTPALLRVVYWASEISDYRRGYKKVLASKNIWVLTLLLKTT